MFACLFAAGVYGCMKVEEGLDLTDVVPRTSPEHQFVEARSKYFSFYPMAVVTKGGYDYPNGQEFLYKFHDAFKKVKPWCLICTNSQLLCKLNSYSANWEYLTTLHRTLITVRKRTFIAVISILFSHCMHS